MTILHLIKSLGRGGAEMLLPETIRLHNKDQFEFHCIYFLPWKDQMVSAIEAQGAKVTCFSANNNFQIIRQIPSIIKYIKENNIQVIHSHLPWAGFAARLIHKRMGIPVLYTEHNKQERYHRITKWLNRASFNWQTLAIAVSADVEASIRKNIHPRIPVRTVLNGVNTQLFQRQIEKGKALRKQYGIPENAIVLGNLAVFRYQKRLPEWLEIIRELHDKFTDVRGLLVGAGPLKEAVEARVRELNLQAVVFMPGLQTNTVDWLSAMDIFMMSSEFEGLPIALLEAMSCGCAIVSTDAGGIKEVIRQGADGLLAPVDEWQQLAGLVGELIEDPALLTQMQLSARKRVTESFSLERMVAELEDIYTSFKP